MTFLRNIIRHNGLKPVATGLILVFCVCMTATEYRDRVSGDEACRSGDFPSGASFYRNYRKLAEKQQDSDALRDAFEREIDALIRAGLGNEAESVLNQYEKKYDSGNVDSTSVALWRANIRILQNRAGEGEKILEQILNVLQQNDPRRKQAVASLAFVRENQKKYQQAAQLYDELALMEGDAAFKRNCVERSILMHISAKKYDKALKKLLDMPLANKSERDLLAMKLLSFYLRLEKDPPAETYPAWEEIIKAKPEIRDSVLYAASRMIADSFLARKDYKNSLFAGVTAYHCASSATEERNVLTKIIETLEKNANAQDAAHLAMAQYELFQGAKTIPETKLRYCQLLIHAGLNDSALKTAAGIFDEVKSKDKREKLFRSIFKAFLHKNAFQHGEKLLDIYLSDQKDSSEYLLTKAALYYREGKKKEAADLCIRTAISDNVIRDKAYRRAITIYAEIRDHKKVLEICDKILKDNPQDPVLFYRANAHKDLNHFGPARKDFNAYLRLPAAKSPSAFRIQAEFRIAETYMMEGKEKEAVASFQKIFRNYQKSEFAPAAGYWLVHANLSKNNSVNAERLTWQMAERYPESIYTFSAVLRLAAYYRTQNATDRAGRVLESAVTQTRYQAIRARALYEKALIAYQQKNYELAEKTIQELLTQFPQDVNAGPAIYLRGDLQRHAKKYTEAIADYQLAAQHGKDTHLEQAALGAEGDCNFALAAKADKAELYQKALLCYKKVLECKNVLPEYRAMAIYKSGKSLELAGAPADQVFAEYKKMLYLVVPEQAKAHPAELFWIVKGIDSLIALTRISPTGENTNTAIEATNYLGKAGLIPADTVRKRVRTLRRKKYRPIIQEIHKK